MSDSRPGFSSTGVPVDLCRAEAGPYYCPVKESAFNYRPSLPANIILLAFFAVGIVVAAFTMKRYKTWSFSTVLIIGCAVEIIGYVGRIMAHYNPFNADAFLMQICCLTFAPVFFAAAIYFTLSRIVTLYGPEHSRIPPVAYTWIFLTADVIALVLQAAGGGLASVSAQDDENPNAQDGLEAGNNIMIAGLLFQVVTLVVFIAVCTDFAIRRWLALRRGTAKPTNSPWQRKVLFAGIGIATFCVLLRSIYRVAELWQGWDGPLMSHEAPFIGLEGVLLVVAVICLSCFNPGWGFRDGHVWRFGDVSVRKLRTKNVSSSSSSDLEK